MKHTLGVAIGLALFLAGMLVGGFVLFVSMIETRQPDPANLAKADGIVVLTGARERIRQGIALLEMGKGRRLLISGVNRRTSRRALRRLVPDHERLFDCCIDIGYDARDTVGNAEETRTWAEAMRFRTLIVVTSSYHMPRGLAELRRALPEARLIAYPVVNKRVHVESWWSSPGTARLLAKEYVKFLPTALRLGLAHLVQRRDGVRAANVDPPLAPVRH